MTNLLNEIDTEREYEMATILGCAIKLGSLKFNIPLSKISIPSLGEKGLRWDSGVLCSAAAESPCIWARALPCLWALVSFILKWEGETGWPQTCPAATAGEARGGDWGNLRDRVARFNKENYRTSSYI